MSRKARTRSSLAVGLVVFLVAGLWFASRQLAHAGETPIKGGDKIAEAGAGGGNPAKMVVFPLPGNFKVKLLRAGLTPRALAAAGLAQGSILSTLQAAADQMNGAPTAMENADTSYGSARVASDALIRKIQSGKASQEEIASYPAVKSALESATALRQSVLDGYFAAAIASLTQNQRAVLTTIRANKSWGFRDEYLVANRTDTQWLALRDALANEHGAIELPETLSESGQALLTTVRAEPAVAFAATSVQTNLAPVTGAWNTAAGD